MQARVESYLFSITIISALAVVCDFIETGYETELKLHKGFVSAASENAFTDGRTKSRLKSFADVASKKN